MTWPRFVILVVVLLGLCHGTPTSVPLAIDALQPAEKSNSIEQVKTDQSVKLPELGGVPKKRLLIAVVSTPSHFRAREAIRNSWAITAKAHGIDVRFFVGIPSTSTPDRDSVDTRTKTEPMVVRFSHFVESYQNLVEKAIAIFAYGADNGYDGVMKVDDDSYLHVDRLMGVLGSQDWTNLWAARFLENNKVNQNPKSKWYAFDQYPHKIWPKYPAGAGFFLGTNAIKYIRDKKSALQRFRVDDAAVGVWLSSLNLHSVSFDVNICKYYLSAGAVVDNPLNFEEMQKRGSESNMVLQACLSPPTDCLCVDNPNISEKRKAECRVKFAKEEYKDLVPRGVSLDF